MDKYFDLTQPQMRIWETEQFFQGTSINNIGGALLLQQELDFELWQEAIFQFIESNDSIRLRVRLMDGKPVQYLSDYKRSSLQVIDFSGKTKDEQDNLLSQLMKTPFKLMDSDLYKFYLIKSWDGEQGYYCIFHHLICDAWTISLLGTQTMENYKWLKEGDRDHYDAQPSYLEYIATELDYMNSAKYQSDREYWLNKFKDKPNPVAIKAREKDYYSSESSRKTYLVEGEQADSIRRFCKEKSTSPAVLFEAALCVYLSKFLNQWEVPLGSLILNRSGSREKSMTGMFISTVPLKVKIDKADTYPELCGKIGKEHMEVFRHQKYPYNILLSEVRKIHKLRTNLYDFSVSYQNSKIAKTNYDYSFRTTWYSNGNLDDSLCLHIDDRDGTGIFVLHFDYLTDLFTEKEISDLHKRIMLFLMQGIDGENRSIADMELTDQDERQQLLDEFNNTHEYVPCDRLTYQMFEEQAAKSPETVALRFEERTMTYGELNRKADQLARLLRSKGVRQNQVVGLMLRRSMEMIIGVLGVMKAGAAYLPIDPEYPPERIEYILKDSRVNLLLIQAGLKSQINCAAELVEIDDPAICTGEYVDFSNTTELDDLAYVIYTSGSTGNPKGVMVTHRNLVNAAFAWRKNYRLDQFQPRLLQTASFSFDVFAGDFCRALLNGGEMIICPNKDQYNPKNLYALIDRHKVNIFESTPALIIPLMNYVYENQLDISSLKLLIIGSDVCPINHFREIVERYGTRMRVLNSYGVTEATIDTSYYEEPLENIPLAGNTPIGKPMPNMKLLIMNEQLKLLPAGVYGELCIGGAGVTKGYVNKPELTAEKFVLNPYDGREVLYRTGDLARLKSDGNVEFMGRIDNQVKIRGLRIELGEIEAVLLKHEAVEDAVVVAKSTESGNKYLCGYIVSAQDMKSLDLKSYLLKSLPDYMVPSYFVPLDRIPLTPNGKVERKQLPEPDRSSLSQEYAAPRNQCERAIAEICCEVLELKKIGIDDNLFDSGADSLSVIQIQIKTYAYEWNLTMQDFYKYPTIRQLAEHVSSLKGEENAKQEESFGTLPEIRKNSGKIFDYCSRAVDALKIKSVLLTGATGYLGIHILYELLINDVCDVYCIVRGKSKVEARARLMGLLRFYFPDLDRERIEKRVFVFIGNLSEERFGLERVGYEALGKKTDVIIHSAANVKHYGNYEDFQEINVFGTMRMIDYALEFKIPLNHISTVSVAGDYLTEHPEMRRRFTEKDFYIGQNYMDNLYVRSKFEAENLVLKAIDRGLDATIFRMGNLTGRYTDGIFQKNISDNAFYNRLKSIIDMKAVPRYLLSQEIEFTPVDYAGRIIAVLSMKRESRDRVFHLYNHNKLSVKALIESLNDLSMDIEILDNQKFDDFVKEISGSSKRQKSLAGIINDLQQRNGVLNYRFPIEPDSKITREFIRKYGLEWPEIDPTYIKKIVAYMKRVNFISERSLAV